MSIDVDNKIIEEMMAQMSDHIEKCISGSIKPDMKHILIVYNNFGNIYVSETSDDNQQRKSVVLGTVLMDSLGTVDNQSTPNKEEHHCG